MGDNSDLFPYDSKAKYDSDGDGVANYYDTFPDNENMDSWIDLMYRVILFTGFAVLAIFIFLQNRKNPNDSEKWLVESDEMMLNKATDGEFDRPNTPPPPGSFQ